ncbi:MAG TPA: GNAT family N-acetyltransferase [Pyrinomonadaceae bacterium]|jgi:ribosomal protein S18 acetylase RimI-like enzyme
MNTNRKTNLPFGLRTATGADEEFLYRLYCTTREDELNAAGFPPEQHGAFLRMQFNAQKTHYEKYYPAAEHKIITVENKPVGRQYVDRGEGEILLVDLALLPEFCNRGIGTILLKKLCSESEQTAKPLRLYAIKFNESALRFYKRLGFVEIDDTGVYLFLEWSLQSGQ